MHLTESWTGATGISIYSKARVIEPHRKEINANWRQFFTRSIMNSVFSHWKQDIIVQHTSARVHLCALGNQNIPFKSNMDIHGIIDQSSS